MATAMTTLVLSLAAVVIAAAALLASRRASSAKTSTERARWSVSVGSPVDGTRPVTLARASDGTRVKLRRMTLLEPAGAEMVLVIGGERHGAFASAIDVGRVVPASDDAEGTLEARLRMPAWSSLGGGEGVRLKLSLDVDVSLKDAPGIQVVVTSADLNGSSAP